MNLNRNASTQVSQIAQEGSSVTGAFKDPKKSQRPRKWEDIHSTKEELTNPFTVSSIPALPW